MLQANPKFDFEMKQEQVLLDDATLEARRAELDNFLVVIADNYDLCDYLCDFGMSFYRDGEQVLQKDLTTEEKEGQDELQRIMFDRIMSGEQKVDGKKRNWSNGFIGSRWYDAQTVSTYCRASFISKKDDDRLSKKYRILFRFENREKKCCTSPKCDNKGIGYKKCSICKWSYYCSSECQEQDWKEHKKRCAGYKELLSDD